MSHIPRGRSQYWQGPCHSFEVMSTAKGKVTIFKGQVHRSKDHEEVDVVNENFTVTVKVTAINIKATAVSTNVTDIAVKVKVTIG
jgi:hypothetical protein